MNTKLRFLAKSAIVVWISCTLSVASAQSNNPRQKAEEILDATGIKGGLVVHIGCGDGKCTAALQAGENYLVHGLGTDAKAVSEAQKHIRERGLYGPVSIRQFDGRRLPYMDNLVNVIVAEDLGRVSTTETMRVLAPGGVLCVREEDGWTRTVKPKRNDTDEWTHYLHDASGNAVAHDAVVGPPRYVQWIAGPQHTRSHEHTPSINTVVSASGRIFYIADEGSIASIQQKPQWHLAARDAYNGTLLWKRPIAEWYPHIVNWGQVHRQLQRMLVAVGDRVYGCLGLHAPLSVLDSATGRVLRTYENTHGTEEIIWHKGVLVLVLRDVTEERATELKNMAQLTAKKESPLHKRETAEPFIKRFRSAESKGAKALLAMDADTGRMLWEKTGSEIRGLRSISLCAAGDCAFYQNGKDVVCVDLKTGQEQWAESAGTLRLVCDGNIICAGGKTATVLSGQTGRRLWTQTLLLTDIRDVFVIKGSLWLGGFKPIEGKRGPSWGPYFATQRDLKTGKVLMHIEPENPGHHHRCWQNKATDRYILAGRRGVEFIDLQSGDVLWHSWVRGVCRYGVMPCNGLLYAPPHACGCYISAKLTGFYALASDVEQRLPADDSHGKRLSQGPAFPERMRAEQTATAPNEWPTYRHDAERSGATTCTVPISLERRWQTDVGAKLSSLTVAGGKVFVACVDEHRVCAIDTESGDLAWDFTAGARVDSPPTLHGNRAIFGCRDGYVYSLRMSDGELAWRLRAAGADRLITANGQLESVSPVHGSVLVRNGAACFTAGRSSYLDGGLDLHRIDASIGKTLSRTRIYSPDPETGRQPDQFGPAYMPGAIGEILSGDDQYIYLRDMVLDSSGVVRHEGNPHLFTLTGFLDDSWPHRSYWAFGNRCSLSTGCSGRERNLTYGRLLVYDRPIVYGYGRSNVHWSNQLQDGAYRLFARDPSQPKEQWSKAMPIQIRAMVLADKVLFAAGILAEKGESWAAPGADNKAVLVAVSISDGRELKRYGIDSPPVFDGMAVAEGRVFISMSNGSVVCFAGEQEKLSNAH